LGQNETELDKIVTCSKNKLSVLKYIFTTLKIQIQCVKNKLSVQKEKLFSYIIFVFKLINLLLKSSEFVF